jgi:hypothetical protein
MASITHTKSPLFCTQLLVETLVVAAVEARQVLVEVLHLLELHRGLGRLDDLFLQIGPAHEDDPRHDCVEDEVLVGHDLRRVEGGDGRYEQLVGGLEVPHHQQVHGLIHLELVLALPVAALFEEDLAVVDDILHLVWVRAAGTDIAVLEVDSEDLEVDVHLLAYFDRLLEGQLVDLDSFVLVVEGSPDEVGLGEDGVAYFDVAEVQLCVGDLVVEFLELLGVVLFLLDLHLKYF